MISGRKPLTVAETLAEGVALIAAGSGESARADAQILLASVLQRERGWLAAHGDAFLSRAQAEKFFEHCAKRASGVPVAYITGFAGFYGREFAVNEHVLVPRPETELLVEDALAHLRAAIAESPVPAPVVTVFEAGVGSGAIGCTIAAEIPHAALDATDVSAGALETAKYNARRLNVHSRCSFAIADVVKAYPPRRYHVVVANLPYIPTASLPQKPDPAAFEPRAALDGGPDGLQHYRKLLARLPHMVRAGSLVLLEAAPPTIGALAALTRAALPDAGVEIRHDYAGLERYVAAVTPRAA